MWGGGCTATAYSKIEARKGRVSGERVEEGPSNKRFRGWLVFKAHRLLYHSTLGLRVIKKKQGPSSHSEGQSEPTAPDIRGNSTMSRRK